MTVTQQAFVPALVEPDFDSFAVRQAIVGKWSYYSIIDERLHDLGIGIGTLASRRAVSS